MQITKYAHSCLLIEVNGVKLLTDPGKWNSTPEVDSLDAILITHEHTDHFDVEQVKTLVARNSNTKVITHEPVGKILDAAHIPHTLIEPGETIEINGVSVQSFGIEHAVIYGDVSPCRNTGYLINNELFAPGDALHDVPPNGVRILALPCGGPWMRLSEAIDYAKKIKPTIVFPIHDAMYLEAYRGDAIPRTVGGKLKDTGITFVDMSANSTQEF